MIPELCVFCMDGRPGRAVLRQQSHKQPVMSCKALKYNDLTSLLFGLA